MKKYIIKAEPITAIHIGSGTVLDPMDYTIDNGRYIRFSAEKVIGSMDRNKRDQLLKLAEGDNHKEMAQFLHKNINDLSILYQAPVSPSIEQSFKKNIKYDNNRLYVDSMYRDGRSGKAVIPGSSLKGAIRTAIANKFGLSLPQNDYYGKKRNAFEKDALQFTDAKNDPFRAIFVSDCPIEGENSEYVADFVNFMENRKKNQDISKMSIRKELIIGKLLDGDAHGICELSINDELQKVNVPMKRYPLLTRKIRIEEIVQYCNDFYSKNFNDEFEKFYKNSKYPEIKRNGERLKGIIDEIKPRNMECLIRVGRFSQVENVTVEKHRKPRNKKGYGATRTITENFFPAGYVKLTFIPFAEYWEEEKKRKLEFMKMQLLEEKRRKEEEARRKAEEERISNMSEDEKMLEEIDNLNDNTNDIGITVNKCLNGDYAPEVFASLKRKLMEFDEWKPYGSKQKKLKMQKRNAKIEEQIEK